VNRFWPDSKASIVLLPSGEQGAALLDLAAEWTKTGLLGPALWVMPERFDGTVDGPPRIGAVVLGIDRDLEIARVEVDLFEALAREPLSVVRLVTLRSVVPSRELDAEQDAITDRLSEYVRKSVPMPSPTATIVEQPTDLRKTSLICAPTEYQLKARVDWAADETGVIVVASPEDRSSPWSGDAFVRDNERFVGFTLMHLASVAGLWNGIGEGSFELFHREQSGHQSVWISRNFVNAVLTESLGQRTAARVLTDAARPSSLLVDASANRPPIGTAFIQDSLVSGYVDEMVRGAMSLDDGALAFHEAHGAADPSKARVGILRGVGGFFAFSGQKLAGMPRWSWRWLTSRTSRRLTRSLHSDQGAAVIGPEIYEVLDVRDRIVLAEAQRIKDDEQMAKAQAKAPAGLAHVRTTPRLWARLRELVFGALDGSADLSDLGFAPIEGSVPIFGRVSDVLALPDTPWTAPRGNVPEGFPQKVDWHALALDQPRERLEEWVQEAADTRAAAETRIAELSAEVQVLQSRSKSRPAAPAPELGLPDDAEAPAAPKPPQDPQEAVVASRLVEAQQEHHDAELEFYSADAALMVRTETLENYDAWAVTQDRSFIWQLLARLSDERRTAERRSRQLSDEIEATKTPAVGELLRLRRRFHLTMLVGWSVGLLFTAAVFAGFFQKAIDQGWDAALEPSPRWTILGIIAVGLVLLTLIALIAYHAGWSKFERGIDLERVRLRRLGAESRRARQEATRLASLHRQTVDWLVLLSRAIHRPWLVPAKWTERQSFEVERSAMPFALQIATIPDDDSVATSRLQASMVDHLFVKGWRHSAFESLVREVAADKGGTGSFGLSALDDDLPHSSNHTRAMLLTALDDEKLLTKVAGPLLEELVTAAQRDEEHGGRPRVRPVGDNPLNVLVRPSDRLGADHDGVEWDDFLLDSIGGRNDPVTPLSTTVVSELELGERHHERVMSHFVVPERLAPRLSFHQGARVSLHPFTASVRSPVDLAWRVDVAGPMPRSAVKLWASRARAVAPVPEPGGELSPVDSGV